MNNIRKIKEEFSKYFIFLFFIIAVYMVFLVIKPFIVAILTSIIASYIFYPLYRWINKKTKRKNLSAVIVTIFIITLIITPILFIANSLTKEVMIVYTDSKQRIEEGNIIDTEPGSILWKLNSFLVNIAEKPQISSSLDNITNSIISSLSNFIFTIPKRILSFFVMIFLIFFMLRDGELMVKKIKCIIPLKNHYQNKIVKKFGSVTHAVIYGHFITALIQGMVGVLGLYIFVVKSPLVWGGIMMVACMIPFVGAPIVWFPLGVFKLIIGLTSSNSSAIIMGTGLLIYGFVIISSIDNLIKPKIIGDKARIHPTIIILGILGGLAIFGFIGIVVGPLILSLFLTFAEIYKTDII